MGDGTAFMWHSFSRAFLFTMVAASFAEVALHANHINYSSYEVNGLGDAASRNCSQTVAFASLELLGPVFSGNGVYARNLLQGLLGNDVCVVVFSGRLDSLPLCDQPDDIMSVLSHPNVLQVVDVAIPKANWYRNDAGSGWQAFRDGIRNSWESVKLRDFSVFIGVDFPATIAYSHLKARRMVQAPLVYLNFRVFSDSVGLAEADVHWYRRVEGEGVKQADVTVALSHRDAQSLNALGGTGERNNVTVLLPTLRSDLVDIARQHTFSPLTDTRYFACCVRLSPEKHAMLFADVIAELQTRGVLNELGITPLLCGAISDPGYAAAVNEKLKSSAPQSVVMDSFLGPDQLRDLFSNTIVNFHPPLYDAYGMTVVEAAAFGVPSIVHADNVMYDSATCLRPVVGWCETASAIQPSVGVVGLLHPCRNEVIGVDLSQDVPQIADAVADVLRNAVQDRCNWSSLRDRAKAKALSWQQEDAAVELVNVLRDVGRARRREASNE